ncbi:MAG: hypothetical protein HYV60_17855 [Planctomycetia bacterium]|nr:hypothetical protein [Planctomycetia bacterium]
MSRKQCIRWLVCAGAVLLANANAARADTWSSPNDCGCGNQFSPTSRIEPFAGPSFSMRQVPPYNTSWARVPVTNYRPQVVNDPDSGVSFTSLQPCNTYEWQMRRTAGCSLWQDLVDWWRSCCLCGCSRPAPSAATCSTPSDWVVSSPTPAASPYYTPTNNVPSSGTSSSNGRLVPVASSVIPTSPVPADQRPRLDPPSQRPGGGDSALRVLPLETEVLVRTLVSPDGQLELTAPLVAPVSPDADTDSNDDLQHVPALLDIDSGLQAASTPEKSQELHPISWSLPAPAHNHKLPTNEVWDDTGWRSEQ